MLSEIRGRSTHNLSDLNTATTTSMEPLKNDKMTAVLRDWAADRGVTLLSMADVEKLGEQFPRKHIPPKVGPPVRVIASFVN